MVASRPRPSPVILCALVGLLPGCSAEKAEYHRASELHREHIAHVAAFSPFLSSEIQDPEQLSSVWRFGARQARAEVLHWASMAHAHRSIPGVSPTTAAQRVARAFEPILRQCTIAAEEQPVEAMQRPARCLTAIKTANAALLREDERAVQLGMSHGTIPQISSASVTTRARAAAQALSDQLAPPPKEILRRKLWQDPDIELLTLRNACVGAREEARALPTGLGDDIAKICGLLGMSDALLRQASDCGDLTKETCRGESMCGLLAGNAKDRNVAAMHIRRLEDAAKRCRRHQEALRGLEQAQ